MDRRGRPRHPKRALALELIAQGVRANDIAIRCGCNASVVYRWAIAAGMRISAARRPQRRPPRPKSAAQIRAEELILLGWRIRRIAAEVGRSRERVRQWRLKLGLPPVRHWRLDLQGTRFGRLLVLGLDPERTATSPGYSAYWNCRCDCGKEVSVSRKSLRRGSCQSCGCWQRRQLPLALHHQLAQQVEGGAAVGAVDEDVDVGQAGDHLQDVHPAPG